MSTESASIFELVRREGLIVLALGALVYQVYWMTTGFSEADRLWREEVAAWRVSSMETDRQRTEAKIELASALQQAEDRIHHIEQIADRMEKECKIFMAIQEREKSDQ